jgi:hypothetical protein
MGMPPLTLVHVIISLIAIATGFIVLLGMLGAKRMDGMNAIFLIFTILTSVTGFAFFPFEKVTPGFILGILSLVSLAIAVYARYLAKMAGGWRTAYVVTAMLAQWFNVFVLFAQIFQKAPAAKALPAPAFLVTEVVVMVLFIVLIVMAVKKYRAAV